MSLELLIGAALVYAATSWMSPPTPPDQPSFDCKKARNDAAKLVCADRQLAQLDREVARLYALAGKARSLTADRRNALTVAQRGWIQRRDQCGSADDMRACTRDSYVVRISDLRQGYPAARTADADGISSGPVATRCDRLDQALRATFIRSAPSLAHLAWNDRALVMIGAPSDSGVKYATAIDKGEAVFWQKGKEAVFDMPGEPSRTCTLAEPG